MNSDGRELIELNLAKRVKEGLEEIAERGQVESQEEQILVSTAALLFDFLQRRIDQDNRELKVQIKEQQKEVGLFFPLIAEAFFSWREEGREDIPEEIKRIARKSKRRFGMRQLSLIEWVVVGALLILLVAISLPYIGQRFGW